MRLLLILSEAIPYHHPGGRSGGAAEAAERSGAAGVGPHAETEATPEPAARSEVREERSDEHGARADGGGVAGTKNGCRGTPRGDRPKTQGGRKNMKRARGERDRRLEGRKKNRAAR